jgi:rhamnogalacturonyl hydrolase YesR
VRDLLDSCLAHQRDDGLFHDVIDDPASFVEVNLAQMLAYTVYRGLAGGWLDDTYLSSADRMRAAAQAKVDEHGLVQDVCGAPHFDHPGTAPEGQAFFMLMEAAYRDLADGQ